MNNTNNAKSFDVLAVGELLIDLIGTNKATSLEDTFAFERFQGGSPANFARNLSKLGNRVKLVASIGEDGLGRFLQSQVVALSMDCRDVKMRPNFPTTIITVAKTDGTPDFQAYRGADTQILPDQLQPKTLQQTRIFHTTCFALSKNPAQKSIMEAAQIAASHGCQLSIDINYAPEIWENRQEAQDIIARYCSYGALVKLSIDDWERTYQRPDEAPETIIEFIHNLGAKEVCLTLGSEGSYVSKGGEPVFVSARKIEVADVTGAGDAFWSGYLTAWLDGHGPETCALFGRSIAEIKLQHIGPLVEDIDKQLIYADLLK
ncbi:MAG: sugar kinase [Chitinophagales bacterium]